MTNKVLVVDDEKLIVKGIKFSLEQDGMEVTAAYDGKEAYELAMQNDYDIILLDVMLPDIDGFTILQKIRENYMFPVIMLTAKTEYMDKITGLTLGADDYIEKPFNPLELMARVKAQLRRVTKYNEGTKPQEDIIDFGGLVMNRSTHECQFNERELTLTPIEFDILWILCENRGQVISSEQLFEQVWHETYYKQSNNTVMVHIRHLREKMGGSMGKTDFIKTVWGVGYKVEK